jgi:hypothetical protein
MSEAAARGGFAARTVPLAWSWLGMAVLAMSHAGCLMTSTPQFKAEQHTAPFLVEATALPDTREAVVIDMTDSMSLPRDFGAEVVSQDDPTGPYSVVSSEIVFDYGFTKFAGGPPFLDARNGTQALPGTLDETTGRRVTARYFGQPPLDLGCHTVTLLAAHQFDVTSGCPCPNDYSMITWQVLVCNSSMGNCANIPLSGMGACPLATSQVTATNCEQFLADAGSSCPSPADVSGP